MSLIFQEHTQPDCLQTSQGVFKYLSEVPKALKQSGEKSYEEIIAAHNCNKPFLHPFMVRGMNMNYGNLNLLRAACKIVFSNGW